MFYKYLQIKDMFYMPIDLKKKSRFNGSNQVYLCIWIYK